MALADVAVIILTKNEEIHIERCIASVKAFARSVHVIDSGSTDRTRDIAARLGAEVLENAWINHADQFQWACDHVSSDAQWIMRLDADEIIENDLATEIQERLDHLPHQVVGVTIDRKHVFMDKWIRHGGRFPIRLLRIFRQGKGRVEQRWMDEHILVWGGETVHFKGLFVDHNLNDSDFFTTKHLGYATKEAIEILNQRMGLFPRDQELMSGGPRQAAAKRWVKENLYNRIPFPIATLGYFLYRYVVQRGFLDGREGLIYHFLQGFWYRFQVGVRLAELERIVAASEDPPLVALQKATGLQLGKSQARP
jgi:glycosyltransferase involved in cell wall biosynthesis